MTSREVKAFQSAAARRRAVPPEWDVDGETLFLLPKADVAQLAPALDELNRPAPPGQTGIEMFAATEAKLAVLRDVIGTFIREDCQDGWERVREDQDVLTLTGMVNAIVAEYTGVDPTLRASSSTPSPENGDTFVDGAQAVESTSLDSTQVTGSLSASG